MCSGAHVPLPPPLCCWTRWTRWQVGGVCFTPFVGPSMKQQGAMPCVHSSHTPSSLDHTARREEGADAASGRPGGGEAGVRLLTALLTEMDGLDGGGAGECLAQLLALPWFRVTWACPGLPRCCVNWWG